MTALILTEGSPQWTIPAGGDVNVFGTAGVDALAFEEGASVTLDASFNAGNDTLYFEGDSTDFTVRNEGATVILTDGSGNEISLAAGTAGQTLVFGDGAVVLQIDTTAGTVNFGDQVVTDTDTAVTATVDDTTTSDDQFGGTTPALDASLSISDATVAEDGATATFTVTLSDMPGVGESVSVDYATADGTATAGTDYTAASGTLTFGQGVTTQTITVDITDDFDVEDDETFTVTLSNATGSIGETGATIDDAEATGTITNDDVPATFAMTIEDSTLVEEGQNLVFTITPSSTVLEDTTLYIQLSGAQVGAITDEAEANDFGASLIEVNFTAGDSEAQTIEVAVTNDGTTEGAEGFQADLLDVSFAAIEGESLTGTINDNVTSGQTYNLTNEDNASTGGTDIYTGTAGNDTFNAFADDSFTDADNIDGGDGVDTLYARYTTDADETIAPNAQNLEIVNVRFTVGDNDDDFVFSAADLLGLQELWNNESQNNENDDGTAETLTFDNVEIDTTIGLRDTGVQTIVEFNDVTGDEDEAFFILDGVDEEEPGDGAGSEVASSLTADDVEIFSISTENNASVLSTLDGDSVETLNISGDQDLTIVNELPNVDTLDASEFTGNLNVMVGGSNITLTGGSGDDVIDMQDNLGSGDTIDGGDGTDRLAVGAADEIQVSDFDNVSNIEELALNEDPGDAGNVTVDMEDLGSDFTSIFFALTDNSEDLSADGTDAGEVDSNQTITVNNLDSGNSVELTSENRTSFVEMDADNDDDDEADGVEVPANEILGDNNLLGDGDDVDEADVADTSFEDGINGYDTVTLSLDDDSGSSDEINLFINNNNDDLDLIDNLEDFSTLSGQFDVGDVVVDDIEIVNIQSTGDLDINNITDLQATDATQINISGSQYLDIDNLDSSDLDASTEVTIDASENTGGFGIDIATAGLEYSIIGTSANDYISFEDDTLDDDQTIDGGEGEDTLFATGIGDGQTSVGVQSTNVETLDFTIAAAADLDAAVEIDLGDALDYTQVNLDVATADENVTLDDIAEGVAVTLVSGANFNDTVTLGVNSGVSELNLTIGEDGRDGWDAEDYLSSEADGDQDDVDINGPEDLDGTNGTGFDADGGAGELALDNSIETLSLTVDGEGGKGGEAEGNGEDGDDGDNADSAIDTFTAANLVDMTIDLSNDADFTITTLATGDLESLTLTGGDSSGDDLETVTLGTSGDMNDLAVIDASDLDASFDLGSIADDTVVDRAGTATITGSSHDDMIALDVNQHANNVINAGNNEDTDAANDLFGDVLYLTGTDNAGTTVVDLSEDDQLEVLNGVSNAPVQEGFESIDASGLTNAQGLTLTGSDDDNQIIGAKGDDVIDGGDGADEITGGEGADTIDLGSDDEESDTVIISAGDGVVLTADTITEANVGATETITFENGVDIITEFEAGEGGDIIEGLGDDVATDAVTTNQSAANSGTTYYLDGDYDAETGVFTGAADGEDLLLWAGDDTADLTSIDTFTVLIGVAQADLHTDNFVA